MGEGAILYNYLRLKHHSQICKITISGKKKKEKTNKQTKKKIINTNVMNKSKKPAR